MNDNSFQTFLRRLVRCRLGQGEEQVDAENRHPEEHRDPREVETVAKHVAAGL